MKNRRNKKGFTIVELVIVIGVIGILSAILIPTFASLNSQAEAARLQSNLHNAFSMYAADAADGKVGEAGAALVTKAQNEVYAYTSATLTSGDAYVWNNTTGQWDGESVSTEKTGVANPNPSYLGYYFFIK